jgi:hypothetical protein
MAMMLLLMMMLMMRMMLMMLMILVLLMMMMMMLMMMMMMMLMIAMVILMMITTMLLLVMMMLLLLMMVAFFFNSIMLKAYSKTLPSPFPCDSASCEHPQMHLRRQKIKQLRDEHSVSRPTPATAERRSCARVWTSLARAGAE